MLYWIFGALFVVITGLTVALIMTWTALKEEQARSFNQRIFNRIVSMEQHPSIPGDDLLNHPMRKAHDEDATLFFDQDAV